MVKLPYIGQAPTVLDDKNRVTLPNRFRRTLDDRRDFVWYAAYNYDESLVVFPEALWDEMTQRLCADPMDAEMRVIQRFLMGSATEVRPDKQGRIPLAPHLRKYAQLEREALFVGMGAYLELWDREKYFAFETAEAPSFNWRAAQAFERVNRGQVVTTEETTQHEDHTAGDGPSHGTES